MKSPDQYHGTTINDEVQKMEFTTENSRREFLKQLALLGAASCIPLPFMGCGEEINGPEYHGKGLAPYKIWEEMLMALQTSPDHLRGRMKTLISEGDPKAMFHFVRDEFYLLPTYKNSIRSDVGTLMRYGVKGALRTGFATPREKAELLNRMFTEAGIPSKVIFERTDIAPEEVAAFFYGPVERKFAPLIDEETFSRWTKELQIGETDTEAFKNIDPDLSASKQLANSLWNQLPDKAEIEPSNFDARWPNRETPSVAFEFEGRTQYAHLFDPKVPFGCLRNNNSEKTSDARTAEYTDEKVKISLTYRDGISPREEKELLKGEWFIHELVGNQIILKFMHGLSMEEQAVTSIGNLRIFTPVLSFQSLDADLPEMQAHSFVGKPITLEGQTIDVTGEQPKIGQHTLSGKPNKKLQKKVARIEATATPNTYPLVKIGATALDADGNFVEGLGPRDFKITDNGTPISAIMERNQKAPRILILHDGSLSMPYKYRDEKMEKFVTNLKNAILEEYEGAIIEDWKTSSALYSWLLKASQTNNDLIIYATDGHNSDTFDKRKTQFYKNGAPAVVLNVTETDYSGWLESFNKMAEVTNGTVIDAKDQEKTIKAIVTYLEKIEIAPYVFTYYAAGMEIDHTASISVDNNRVSANSAYKFKSIPKVPDTDIPAGQKIAGLYLKIETYEETIERVYSGWNPKTDNDEKPSRKNFLDVKSSLLGGAVISIEGEGPTLSTSLSDLLKYRLSTRKWGEAVLKKEYKTAQNEFAKGGFIYDPRMVSLMAPLSEQVTKKSFTYATGPRIAILKNKIGLDGINSSESFDYLPSSNYTTFSKNPADSFKITMEKTAQLAIREKVLFEHSTYNLLEGIHLVERSKIKGNDEFRKLYYDEISEGYWNQIVYRKRGYNLIDNCANVKAYWNINKNTGELYGILPDGTGGGSNSVQQQLEHLNKVIDLYMAQFNLMGVANPAIGIVAAYGKTLVKLYAIASEAIIIMNASGMDEKIEKALMELACNVAKEIAFGFPGSGSNGKIMGGLDTLIGLMGGGGLIKC